jgi:hypothetical protein
MRGCGSFIARCCNSSQAARAAAAASAQSTPSTTLQTRRNTMTRFNTRPALHRLGEALTLAVMIGMTAASAATFAPLGKAIKAEVSTSEEAIPRLPTVVVTAKRTSAS